MSRYRGNRDAAGHAVVVRNGTARPRAVTTGVGPIPIAAPRVNDKRLVQGERQRFTSAILPPYLRRSPRLAGVLPLLYLHGLSSGDFREALPARLGPDAAGLAPSTITRLTKSWTAEYEAFRRRDLADRDYVYLWADGIHFTIRLEDERLCAPVLIGVRPDGSKEVVALEDGYRESAESWRACSGISSGVACVPRSWRSAKLSQSEAQSQFLGCLGRCACIRGYPRQVAIHEAPDAREMANDLLQELKVFARDLGSLAPGQAGDIRPWPRETCDKSLADRIDSDRHHDRDGRRRLLRGDDRRIVGSHDQRHVPPG